MNGRMSKQFRKYYSWNPSPETKKLFAKKLGERDVILVDVNKVERTIKYNPVQAYSDPARYRYRLAKKAYNRSGVILEFVK